MRRITLRSTALETSLLGFGCAGLTALNDRGKAVAILNQALDLGITHFDSAPAYGFGQAEAMLGEFLRGKRRDQLTITTKFGLQLNPAAAKHAGLIGLARKIAHAVPVLKKLARRASKSMVRAGVFTPAEAEVSLTKSLATLGTDHIDLFLLHEATLDDAKRADLLEFLDKQVAKGTIRYYGVGADPSLLRNDLSLFPPSMRVFQSTGNVASFTGANDRGLILFGVLGKAKPLLDAAKSQPALAQQYSKLMGRDLLAPGAMRDYLLQQAIAANPTGIVLFATASPEHLRDNVRTIDATPLPGETLAHFSDFARQALPA